MQIKHFKCPEENCDGTLNLNEDKNQFGCDTCDHSVEYDKAESLFESGDLVAIADKDDLQNINEDDNSNNTNNDEDIEFEVDMNEDVNALFKEETDISEEFKEKTKTIFESAVHAKAKEVVEAEKAKLQEQYETQLHEKETELVENLDEYLDYAIKEWIEENNLAVETGLRNEILEDLMSGMKKVFTENNVDIPEGQEDVVEKLTNRVESLESELNEETKKNAKLNKEIAEQKKNSIVDELSEDLADTQKEKLQGLTEGVEFKNEESFREKVKTLKESYITSSSTTSKQDDETPAEEIEESTYVEDGSNNFTSLLTRLRD